MSKTYYRPLPMTDISLLPEARRLAGGWTWFDRVEVLSRDHAPEVRAIGDVPDEVLRRLTAPRAPVAGLDLSRPNLMGILNVTPDSFSDGGKFNAPDAAIAHARSMVANGADILDIGGESTRPGATPVPVDEEVQRTAPMIAAIRGVIATPISIDTRKAAVAQAALEAGADLVNDVYAFTHDPDLARVAAQAGAPVCLMHAQGDPQVMQDNPHYDDVLLDVYDFLEQRVAVAEAAGIPRDRIVLDPGIGFGKTQAHNLALLRRVSLFHALGCALLLGVSRKGFIGRIGNASEPRERVHGSIAVALAGIAQGVQITRVHDIKETKQAVALWQAVTNEESSDDT